IRGADVPDRATGESGRRRGLHSDVVGDARVHQAAPTRSRRRTAARAQPSVGRAAPTADGALAAGHARRESLMKDWLTNVITRELKALRREIESYPSDADLWEIPAGIANPGGNLALHLAGNLQYFVGNVLGKNGYVRNRDAEFASRDVPRADLLREIDNAISAVEDGMSKISEADLAKPSPPSRIPRKWEASTRRPARSSPTSPPISPTTSARSIITAASSRARARR